MTKRTTNPRLDTIRDLITEAARLRREWASAGLVYRLDLGGLGETIIEALHPTWKRMPPGTPGYDFIDDAELRVQVKTWGTDKRSHDKIRRTADRLIRVQITDTGWDIVTDVLTAPHFARAAEGQQRVRVNRAGTVPAAWQVDAGRMAVQTHRQRQAARSEPRNDLFSLIPAAPLNGRSQP